MRPILWLLAALFGVLVALLTWGAWRVQHGEDESTFVAVRDDLIFGLLLLAAFALGAFAAYWVLVLWM